MALASEAVSFEVVQEPGWEGQFHGHTPQVDAVIQTQQQRQWKTITPPQCIPPPRLSYITDCLLAPLQLSHLASICPQGTCYFSFCSSMISSRDTEWSWKKEVKRSAALLPKQKIPPTLFGKWERIRLLGILLPVLLQWYVNGCAPKTDSGVSCIRHAKCFL